MAKSRQPPPHEFPHDFDELISNGGPEAYVKIEADRAAQEARRLYLKVLLTVDPADLDTQRQAVLASYIRDLRRHLGIRVPRSPRDQDRIREQTRERVRRYRERQKE